MLLKVVVEVLQTFALLKFIQPILKENLSSIILFTFYLKLNELEKKVFVKGFFAQISHGSLIGAPTFDPLPLLLLKLGQLLIAFWFRKHFYVSL